MDPTLRKILLGSSGRPRKKTSSPEEACNPGPPKAGGRCPRCRAGILDYDGCLNLACPRCGYVAIGAFT